MNVHAVTSSFTSVPIDWIIIALIVAIIAIDTLRSGAARAVALVLALPIAAFAINALPNAFILGNTLKPFTTPTLQAGIFIGITIIFAVLIYRITASFDTSVSRALPAIAVGIATTAVLLAIWNMLPQLQSLWQFSSQIKTVFGETYRFWWILGSYILLAAVKA